MSEFLDDLITILSSAGVGTANVNIFKSSTARIPNAKNEGPFITLTESGGSPPEGTHNDGFLAYIRPNVQVVTRGKLWSSTIGMSKAAWYTLTNFGRKSQFVNGVWYRSIVPLQQPFDMGVEDGTGRIMFYFNMQAVKRLNAQMSNGLPPPSIPYPPVTSPIMEQGSAGWMAGNLPLTHVGMPSNPVDASTKLYSDFLVAGGGTADYYVVSGDPDVDTDPTLGRMRFNAATEADTTMIAISDADAKSPFGFSFGGENGRTGDTILITDVASPDANYSRYQLTEQPIFQTPNDPPFWQLPVQHVETVGHILEEGRRVLLALTMEHWRIDDL